MKRLAVILGAGASAEAGVPTAVALTRRLESISAALPDGQARQFENLFRATQARLAHEQDEAASSLDFEAVLGTLIEIATGQVSLPQSLFGMPEQMLRDWIESDELLPVIQRVFGIVREQFDFDQSRCSYLEPLVRLAPRAKLDIFTLNYDLVVEYMLDKLGKQYVDGFRGRRASKQIRSWNPSIFESTRQRIRLFKLHGSIDWGIIQYPWSGQLGLQWYLKSFPTVVQLPEWRDVRFQLPGSQGGAIAVMNIGTRKDVIYSYSPFPELFDNFQRSLLEANVCVVIGYSFRDRRMNHILEDTIVRRRGELKLVIVDPYEPDFNERWPVMFEFLSAGVATSLALDIGTALKQGALERAIKSAVRTASRPQAQAWATVVPRPSTRSQEPQSPDSLWADVQFHVDGIVLAMRRLWPEGVSCRGAGELKADLEELFNRTSALRATVERAQERYELEQVLFPVLSGDRLTAQAFKFAVDLHYYIMRLHFRTYPPEGTTDTTWHIASTVASALDDVEGLLRTCLWHLGEP